MPGCGCRAPRQATHCARPIFGDNDYAGSAARWRAGDSRGEALTHAEEREQYENDYAEWVKGMAVRVRAMYRHSDIETRRDIWSRASPALREEMKRLSELGK